MGNLEYEVKIEIFQGNSCDHHQLGEEFIYPDVIGKLCPWLLDSVNTMVRVMQFGGTLPWEYKGSAYEKLMAAALWELEGPRMTGPITSLNILGILWPEECMGIRWRQVVRRG